MEIEPFIPIPSMEKVIELKGVYFRYPDGVDALRGVDLSVYRGETLAITGMNGAGKSTLLLLLNGTLKPSNGEISILGLPPSGKALKRIRMKVGIVFQNPDDQLFMPRVFDDVAFGLKNMGVPENEIPERVGTALAMVGLPEFEDRASHHLSFGEKKRVSIATVIVMNPEVIIFDEPTANLDPRGAKLLLNLISTLPSTRIIATHDLPLIEKLCDRVVLLHGGERLFDGTVSETIDRVRRYFSAE